jgi:NADH:ubiquinone oxidoreductase subunit 6 (subunit J)
MLLGVAVIISVVCAAAAVRAQRLIAAGIWLAASSAAVAWSLYLLDAPYVGAIELSVGAGLVAVLFVFAVVGAADGAARTRPAVPRRIALVLVAAPVGILAWLVWPLASAGALPAAAGDVANTLWTSRGLDVLGQLVLLLTGVLAVLILVGGLPTEAPADATPVEDQPTRDEVHA